MNRLLFFPLLCFLYCLFIPSTIRPLSLDALKQSHSLHSSSTLSILSFLSLTLQAANLISDAIHKAGNGIIEIRRIDTAKEVAQTVAFSRNVTYIPSTGGSGAGGSGAGGAGTNLLLNLGNS